MFCNFSDQLNPEKKDRKQRDAPEKDGDESGTAQCDVEGSTEVNSPIVTFTQGPSHSGDTIQESVTFLGPENVELKTGKAVIEVVIEPNTKQEGVGTTAAQERGERNNFSRRFHSLVALDLFIFVHGILQVEVNEI